MRKSVVLWLAQCNEAYLTNRSSEPEGFLALGLQLLRCSMRSTGRIRLLGLAIRTQILQFDHVHFVCVRYFVYEKRGERKFAHQERDQERHTINQISKADLH